MNDKMREKLAYEYEFISGGAKYIAGVDEVGRGPLAGPVVCCAVIMPLGDEDVIDGVDDSKKVSEKKRKVLAEEIKKRAIAYKICEISPEEIDEINILQATIKCMEQCVRGLAIKPDLLLVDALKISADCKVVPIIKGDAKSYTIGAASIVAKVYRDALMEKYDEIYPAYDFKSNKGYGTKKHIDAIKGVGACPIHRRTFIKNFSD